MPWRQVSDAGLEAIAGLANLEELHLVQTNITDAGVQHIAGLSKLRRLSISETQITDAGLKQLEGLVNLEVLYIVAMPITQTGIDGLKRSLPNLQRIVRYVSQGPAQRARRLPGAPLAGEELYFKL